ncbi:MAG: Na/Pi cotransporter family protein [Ruminococcaceae bacterium]|jgi:phosphate:Na+ symporter|nr:Na/Pi cotransporter family protein [Oscillospiraceae bacterium]
MSLFSGIALFLFGMSVMGDGLKKVAGSRLELILYRLSGTPLKGVLLGCGVTAVIQSSCATSVMTVGFVNSGMMKVKQAVSVILGAILGTSVTGWVICLSYIGGEGIGAIFSTATLTAVTAVVGILLRMFSKKPVLSQVGGIMMGFAVLMFGMSTMSGSVSSLGKAEWFRGFLVSLSHPVTGILVGTVFTAVLQSASAAVGIVQALSATGAMTFETALPLLMGIAIGASAPVLLSAIGANTEGKRAALVYPVAGCVSALAAAAVFYIAHAIFRFPFLGAVMDPVRIAAVNSILRFAMVALLFPFSDVLESLVNLLVPGKKTEEDPGVRLEDRFIGHPSIAIEQSRLTVNAMADEAENALAEAMNLLTTFSDDGFRKVEEREGKVDRYEDALGSYLVKLTGHDLTKRQNQDVSSILHTLSDFERISDHALNIAQSAQELHEKKIVFSEEARHELDVIRRAVAEIVRLAFSAFTEDNTVAAARVEPLEEWIDNLCDELKTHHVERLQKGLCTIHQGFVFNDLLTDFERISDHCSNIAVAMIELEEDVFDTHEYLNQVKEKRSADFERVFEDYQARFSL